MIISDEELGEQRVDLLSTTDAAVWAAEFMKVYRRSNCTDEGAMIGWFANAFAAAEIKHNKVLDQIRQENDD